MDTERPVAGLHIIMCPLGGLCGDHWMVTIWTLYAHIVTTPAGIFAIRAGLFFTVGRHDRRRLCHFWGVYYAIEKACYIFSTACHGDIECVESTHWINPGTYSEIQQSWKFQQDFLRKSNFFQQRFPTCTKGKSLFAARLHSHRQKTKKGIRKGDDLRCQVGLHSRHLFMPVASLHTTVNPFRASGAAGQLSIILQKGVSQCAGKI